MAGRPRPVAAREPGAAWGGDLVRLLLALLVLGALYGGLAWYAGARAPAGATVGGIHIGGLTVDEAAHRLDTQLAYMASTPVTLQLADADIVTSAPKLGLRVDAQGSAQAATGFTLDPRTIWRRLTETSSQPLKIAVDDGTLNAELTRIAGTVNRPVSEGGIRFVGTNVESTPALSGYAVDVPATARAVVDAWPATTITGVVTVTRPSVAPAEVARVAEDVADRILASPVTLKVGGRSAKVYPKSFAPIMYFRRSGSSLALAVDGAKVPAALLKAAPALHVAPVNATVRLSGGRVVVVPERPGTQVNGPSAAPLLAKALLGKGTAQRAATLPTSPRPAAVTAAKVRSWGIDHVLASVEVPAPAGASAARAANVGRAAARINGVVLDPGKRLSLGARIGRGYADASAAGVADDDRGRTQVASALYAAAFRSGLAVGPRQAPSQHVDGYPLGLDATLLGGDVSLTNDTPYPVIVAASRAGSGVRVTIFGSATRRASVWEGARRGVVPPQSSTRPARGCVARPGSPGFTVTVGRTVRQGADTRGSISVRSHYRPIHAIVCAATSPG